MSPSPAPQESQNLARMLVMRCEEILAIDATHGAHNVRYLGSVSRNEATVESDVDVLVSFEPDRSLLDLAALIDELTTLLGRRVDVLSERGLSPLLRDQILAESRPL